MSDKFVALTAAFVFCASTAVFAQSRPVDQQTNSNPSGSVMQPQGKTGPIVTERGGAPASSPQGDTPAGMQAAPGAPRWQLDVTQGACDQGAEGHAHSQLLRGQAAIGGAPLSPSSVACGG